MKKEQNVPDGRRGMDLNNTYSHVHTQYNTHTSTHTQYTHVHTHTNVCTHVYTHHTHVHTHT